MTKPKFNPDKLDETEEEIIVPGSRITAKEFADAEEKLRKVREHDSSNGEEDETAKTIKEKIEDLRKKLKKGYKESE